MSKSRIFANTADFLTAAFPILLDGLKALSGSLPIATPIQGVVEVTILCMTKVEEYKTSNIDIYLLAARAAQIVTTIVNESQKGKDDIYLDSLKQIKQIIHEIFDWLEPHIVKNSLTKRLMHRLKAKDIIKEVACFNRRLNEAVALSGLMIQIDTQKTARHIQTTVERIQVDIKCAKTIQLIEGRLPPRVETLSATEPRCLPGTRQIILDDIRAWLQDYLPTSSEGTSPSIYWLTGVAGSGKSTISRTIADISKELGFPSSSFFFSRDHPDRRSSNRLITTAALDLTSSRDSTLVEKIHESIDRSGIDGTSTLLKQMRSFLKGPLEAVNRPVVLVWDALDECTEKEPRRVLLELLQHLPELPSSTRIFLTSRPEQDLMKERACLDDNGHVRSRNLTYNPCDPSDNTPADIGTYLDDRFKRMREVISRWPSPEQRRQLNELIGGLFMAAQFVCNFVDIPTWREERLASLLKNIHFGEHGETETDKLYGWYFAGLEQIFWPDTSHEMEFARIVMGTILESQYPLSSTAIANMVDLNERIVDSTLNRLSPFLIREAGNTRGGESSKRVVRFVHKSMADFFESSKAGKFAIDRTLSSAALTMPCLRMLDNHFRSNTSLSLSERWTEPEPAMSEANAYACRFWGYHLKDMETLDETWISLLNALFLEHFLEWLHLMGRMDALEAAVRCLNGVAGWKPLHSHPELLELTKDGIRFIQMFNQPLRTYNDPKFRSLHFTPTNCLLYQKYSKRAGKKIGILSGVPEMWPQSLSILEGHRDIVTSVAFSSDGTRIVSGSRDETLRIWDKPTGQQLAGSFRGHTQCVTSVAFSNNGNQIVSGSRDETVRIWDALTGQQLGPPLEGHTNTVTSVAFSSDGNRIVSGSDDETVRLWDALTGQQIGTPFEGHTRCVTSVAFSSDGVRIVSGSGDKTVCIWNASTGQQLGSPLKGHTQWVMSVALSSDGSRIVSGSHDRTVRIWDALTGQQLGSPFQGHTQWVMSVAFSNNGACVVSGSRDGTVRIWDASTGQQLGSPLQGHTDLVRSVAFSNDGNQIVSGSYDGTVRVWDVSTSQQLGPLSGGHTQWVTSIAFSSDGARVVSGSGDRTVRLWDAMTGQQLGSPFQGHTDLVTSVAFSSDGNRIASGSGDKTVCIWDAPAGQRLGSPLQGHTYLVTCVAFSSDGSRVVSGSGDGTVRVWNASTGQQLGPPLQGHTDSVTSVAYSSDGSRIVSGSRDRTIRIWDASTGQQLGSPLQAYTGAVRSVAFSSNGDRIVSGSEVGTVHIWDASTGQQLGTPLRGHTDSVTSVTFVSDGKHIVSGSNDKTMRTWDALTGNQLLPPLAAGDCSLSSEGWLALEGRQICWLPPHHRGGAMAYSERTSCFAMGGYSGLVTIVGPC